MRLGLVVVLAAVALSGCGHKKRARSAPPPPPPGRPRNSSPAPPPKIGDTESGIASWYGHPYHGRQAADGEIYDMETLVAAHRTLPFNTWVRVLNLRNQKTVDVRIIDRGPFIDGRIIDLSHAAAQSIDLIGPGIGQVRIEVIPPPPAVPRGAFPVETAPPEGAFAVQVGVYQDRNNAERVRAGMAARYGTAKLVRREGDREMWRVLVGAEPTEDAATQLSDRIRQE